jgi:beta-barrel assembly-enhancing protease
MRKIRVWLPAWMAVCAFALTACGTNPVTGKKEIQLISTESEIRLGAENYAPSRQSQGGDVAALPELSTYVNEVGQKLAAVSDRQLPYEFVVLNSSVPNAWALPGGKIAINRGLLTTLENEAELAAVLGHEIVHAAARHGAKAQERGTFLQAGMVAAQIGMAMSDTNPQLGNLVLQGAGVGAQMTMMKYGRDAELEADLYGMQYMRRAGYDPAAAITLQQKFLALSQKDGRNQGWLDGLFASHPPSAERVARNTETSATIGAGGDLGADRYRQRLASLTAAKPAYDKADEAMAAAGKKDLGRARTLAAEAARMFPKEARFHQLQGDIALAEKQPAQAIPFYERSIALDPNYFGSYLGGGVAAYRTGNRPRAEEWLNKSASLLPTAPAAYYLGSMAKESGNTERALQLFKAAAQSQSDIGKQAAAEYTLLDLPRNPGNYVASALQPDGRGGTVVVVENRSALALSGIVVTPVRIDAAGRIVEQARTLQFNRVLQPGERAVLDAGIGQIAPEVLPQLRVRVDRAAPVQR